MLKSRKKIITIPSSKEDWLKYHQISKNEVFINIPEIEYDNLHSSFFSKNYFHYIAKINQEVVGVIKFEKCENIIALRVLGVDKKYQKKGVGSELILFLIRKAKNMKVDIIRTHANYKSKEFYKKMGFKQEIWVGTSFNNGTIDFSYSINYSKLS